MDRSNKRLVSVMLSLILGLTPFIVHAAEDLPIRVLIVDGRNNHAWESTTQALRQILLQTGRFTVDVSTAPNAYPNPRPSRPSKPTDQEIRQYEAEMAAYQTAAKRYEASITSDWENWRPNFSEYDVVVDNYNGPDWQVPVKADLVQFLQNGGGMVVIHGANNAFSSWPEFNRMIGIGWRKVHQGIALTVNDATGATIAEPVDKGIHSGHGSKHPFLMKTRATNHPIMQGLPTEWLHGKDELYHSMRGPAEGVQILASAYSSPDQRGTGNHEPIVWTTQFGSGRVVTNTMGHVWPSAGGPSGRDSLHCLGFQTILARSCEWAAGGPVLLDVPSNFPEKDQQSIVHPEFVAWTASGKTLAGAPQSIADAKQRAAFKKQRNPYALLTPAESIASMQIPKDYEVELVVGEPHVREPVLAVFDGNGRLYVAEMRSYMQDEYGTGTKALKNGRISRHEDTTGDGKLDRHTVFVDGLNLPRMLLPLDDRLAVIETDSTDVISYRDSDHDGVADERVVLHKGSRQIDPARSVEHQDSGLLWAIDNWIYLSRGRERFRFTAGQWQVDPIEFDWNQWGMDQDDTGRLFFNDNSHPLKSFQQHPIYWTQIAGKAKGRWQKPTLGDDYAPEFLTMHSICDHGDRGESHAYQSFTSATGGCVFRGDGLGDDARGDYFICDPTGHIVRQANVTREAGKIVVENALQGEKREFIASTDINFRPVSVTTGPDGAMYLVDMYRGMIQDAPWVNDQMKLFLRRTGLNFNIHNGRIYRIKKRGIATQVPPKLLDLPTLELPKQLASANGWVRDTAQKQIILREDRERARESLADMAASHANPLARLHALWTLEGIGSINTPLLLTAMSDADWRVREAAIRIAEPRLLSGDEGVWNKCESLISDPDPNVARQLILSLGWSEDPRATELIDRVIVANLTNEVVFLSAMTALHGRETPMIKAIVSGKAFRTIKDANIRVNSQRRWNVGIANWKQQSVPAQPLDPTAVKLVENGYQIYAQLCSNCHGSDGRGVQLPGQPLKAPSLVSSTRVLGQKEVLARIVLQGITGPIDGHSYREVMAPCDKHDDQWIASVLSYIRQDWGNLASVVHPEEVAAVRRASRNRYRAWTMDELSDYARPELTNRSAWRAQASNGPVNAAKAINGKNDSCDNPNQPGRWFQLDLGSVHTVTSLNLISTNSERYPRQWELSVSLDGQTWSQPLATGKGHGATTKITFEPTVGQHFRVTQTGTDAHHRWSIIDVKVFGVAGTQQTKERAPSNEKPLTLKQLVAKTGNASKGKLVFATSCLKCHVIDGKGTHFGPDLSKVGQRLKKPAIIESILDPDAVVDPKHRGELVLTSDGKIFSGFVTEETSELISIRTSDNSVHKVSVDEIEDRRKLKQSFMPSGLDRTLTQQELIDLIEYLLQRKS